MSPELPDGIARHLAGSIEATRLRYAARLARCRKKVEMRTVHALRVETRRMLALLDLLDALKSPGPLKKLRKTFKKRLDALDEVRDVQVQTRLLQPLWADFPEAGAFKTFLRRREKKLAAKIARKLKRLKSRGLNERLDQLTRILRRRGHPKQTTGDQDVATRALQEVFNEIAARRSQVRPDDPATIHRLRVGFKRFRYLSELLHPFVPGVSAAQLEGMKAYQAAAGDIQDFEVLLARLDAAVREDSVVVASVKRLRSALLKRRRRATHFFLARMDALFDFDPGTLIQTKAARQT